MSVTTIDTANYAEMAKAMGISGEASKSKSTLARLRINHSAIMGMAEVNKKRVNVEVVEAGTYKLEVPDTGQTYFSSAVTIRPYIQRFMYKRFVKGAGDTKNAFVKTVMADTLNIDLKDNSGKFNCGKPSGYIEDFKALPEDMQNLIRQIKRVRVVFGTVQLTDPVDERGTPYLDSDGSALIEAPFIWEVDNREAFKTIGAPFQTFFQNKRLPVQYNIYATTAQRKLPNGNSYYVPEVDFDMADVLTIDDSDQTTLSSFLEWVTNYNKYIISAWNDITKRGNELNSAWDLPDDQALSVVEEFVDIENSKEETVQ
jgi:hypothetical protein